MDKIELNTKQYHKNCFKCFKCKKQLDLSSFRKSGDTLLCVKHYNDELNPNIKTNQVFTESITKVEKVEKKEEEQEENKIYREEKVDLSKKFQNQPEFKSYKKDDKPIQIKPKVLIFKLTKKVPKLCNM
jgi:hypothetical protein